MPYLLRLHLKRRALLQEAELQLETPPNRI
jgi:hypothetical protein